MLNGLCLYRSSVLWMNGTTNGQSSTSWSSWAYGVWILYPSICSLESADVGHWSTLSNLLLAILFSKSFSYLSRKHGVDWAHGLIIFNIILVEYKQVASADWALLLYCIYSPILVMLRAYWCQCAYSCIPHLDSWER